MHGAKGLEADIVFVLDTDSVVKPRADPSVLVDWPVESMVPQRVAFLANQSRVPASLQTLDATEQRILAREGLNLLYVAMTRARQQLVVSSNQPGVASDPGSWWNRLQPVAQLWSPLAQPADPLVGSLTGGALQVLDLPQVPAIQIDTTRLESLGAGQSRHQPSADAPAVRLGQAVHRVLEWALRATADRATGRQPIDRAQLALAAALELGLPVGMSAQVETLASRVLDSPHCARFFDPAGLHWAGNEVPIADPAGLMRIDRLVQMAADGEWWVLDYKLASRPQALSANRAQLGRYVDAVARLQPGDVIRAAFITAGGEVVPWLDGVITTDRTLDDGADTCRPSSHWTQAPTPTTAMSISLRGINRR